MQGKGALEENVCVCGSEEKECQGDVSKSAAGGSVVNAERGLIVAISFAEPRSVLRPLNPKNA